MSQHRVDSVIESLANVAVGFGVAYISNLLVLPLFGFAVHPMAAFQIGIIYTVISLVRSFCLRRIFNRLKIWRREPQNAQSQEPEGAPEAASAAKKPIPENRTEEARMRESLRMRGYLAWYRGEYLRLIAIEQAAQTLAHAVIHYKGGVSAELQRFDQQVRRSPRPRSMPLP